MKCTTPFFSLAQTRSPQTTHAAVHVNKITLNQTELLVLTSLSPMNIEVCVASGSILLSGSMYVSMPTVSSSLNANSAFTKLFIAYRSGIS